jgi:type VI secretion system protein ImpL
MPQLYTREQFKQITNNKGRAEIVQALAKDAWIWGDSAGTSLAGAGTLFSAVVDLYETDYIRTWDGFLDDLQLVRFATIAQTNGALRILTAPTSPLRGILRVIADNTTLVETPTGGPPQGMIDKTTKRVTDSLTGVLKPMQKAVGMPSVEPGSRVTAHYQWVRQLVSGEAGKTQLDGVVNSITEIQKQIDTLGPDVAGGSSLQILASPSFRVVVQGLREQASALPPAVGRLVTEIAEAGGANVIRSATGQVEEVYAQQIVPTCNNLIANRYPFASTQADVQLADFATVFGYDGLFDRFFTEYLEKQVDTTGSVWTWRPGSVDPSHRLLEQMQQARRIRDMFFSPGAKMPEVRFFVTFSDLDANAQRFVLTVGGVNTDDKHQKQSLAWPGTVPGHATGAFESRYFDPAQAFGGHWAWFRMVEAYQVGGPDAQQRIGLNIHTPHHRVRVTVEPERATGNPFATQDWRQFRCES